LSRKTLLTIPHKGRTWWPDEAPIFWPATQYWSTYVIWERGKEANHFFLF